MQLNDKCEAFDWAYALWYWCTHNYSKFDEKHEAFCKISGEYKLTNIPDIDFEDNKCDEYDSAVMYYHEIDEGNWKDKFNNFCHFMDNDWDNED